MHVARASAALALALLAPCSGRAAETTRNLRETIRPGAARSFAVENLVGRMRITPGSTDEVVVTATVHAESESLAGLVRIERRSGSDGRLILHVHYPLDRTTRLRYPALGGDEEPGGVLRLLSNWSSRTDYDGESVHVRDRHGDLLYVDVAVQVPAGDADGSFENRIGRIDADHIRGRLGFEVASADMRLDHLGGSVRIRGRSGDVRATDIDADWSSELSSGDVEIDRLRGSTVSFEAHSGDVRVRTVSANRLTSQTNSGDVDLTGADLGQLEARAGSGDVFVENGGKRLQSARIRTGSGDVVLRLAPDASFEAAAEHGSGDVRVRYENVLATLDDGEITGYRRGQGGAKITVRTGSGDFTLAPIPSR
jgi:hypothetical protein